MARTIEIKHRPAEHNELLGVDFNECWEIFIDGKWLNSFSTEEEAKEQVEIIKSGKFS